MNTLIIYDSHYGNTGRIAQTIAVTLRGFRQVRAIRVDVPHVISLWGVDLLILGSPTQGFRPTPAMQALLENIASRAPRGLAVACFDTRFRGFFWKHSAAPRMARAASCSGSRAGRPTGELLREGDGEGGSSAGRRSGAGGHLDSDTVQQGRGISGGSATIGEEAIAL